MIKQKADSLTTNVANTDYFTGTAWITPLVAPNELAVNAARVTFEPGARNHWHTHPGGQVLVATEGKGYVQKKGEPLLLLLPGDTVTILAGEEHWHGAAPDSVFTHIAIQCIVPGKGEINWLQPVTEAEYRS